MTSNINTPKTVAAIEQQIAKVTAQLEQARALEYAALEKALLAAQKSVATAQEKVQGILAKAGNTPAANNRLVLAQSSLTEKEYALVIATAQFDRLKIKQDAAQKITLNAEHILTSKKLSKKIKFSKKEKLAVKLIRKTAKAKNKQTKEVEKPFTEQQLKAAIVTETPQETYQENHQASHQAIHQENHQESYQEIKKDSVVAIPVLEQTPLTETTSADSSPNT